MKKPLTPDEFVKLARAMPSDERVPYAFEKRIMAGIAAIKEPDPLALWTHALWRAMAPCLAVMALAAVISFSRAHAPAPNLDAGVELDRVVMEPMEPAFDLDA